MIPGVSTNDLFTISPLLTIIITAMLVLMVDLGLPRDRKSPLVFVSFIGIVVAVCFSIALWNGDHSGFGGTVIADRFAVMFQVILLIVTALSILLSERYIQQKGINYGEYYALLLFSVSGAMLMASSRELITIFIGLEVLSIALYILAGFARTEARSEEAAMKYFLLGAFSSGFFLYGIALIYGGTGTTRLNEIAALPSSVLDSTYALAGAALLIVGLGFKAAIVPFHNWTPDVYEGAPTSVTAFMSAGAKAAAFATFIRVIVALMGSFAFFHGVLWILALLTMVVGNVVAVAQSNIKRMLAYSSVAHAGYILVGLLADNPQGRAGVLFYVLVYTFMNLGAFGILIWLSRRGEELNQIEDLQGLSVRQPAAAALMALFMLSLGGIPPTAGFLGKLYLFIAAVHADQYGLAVAGLLASVIGVFYYLRVIIAMYFQPVKNEYPIRKWGFAPGADIAIILSALLTLGLGLFSGPVYRLAQEGAASISPVPAAVDASSPVVAQAPSTVVVQQASVR